MNTINGFSGKNSYGSPTIENRSPTKSGTATDAASVESSEDPAVNLSSGATAMQKLTQSLASTPSFDQSKVDRIKALIAEGQYTVDPTKIASRFTAFENSTTSS